VKSVKKTVLLIEDEQNLSELIQFRLEANGYKVSTAFDGQEGLEKIKSLKPDLIILDAMLPGMNGFEVCARSKQDQSTKAIPIIMLTARAQKIDKEKARISGADSFITKPFEPADFLKEIRKLTE